MQKNAVGFYWTLPVPWAGFTSLPDDVDTAARASRTIRYQRELVRRHAQEHRLALVGEVVFLELQPDRASTNIRDPLKKAARVCHEQNAVLLVMDFAELQGWRSHAPLQEHAKALGIGIDPVAVQPLFLDGEPFNPFVHFASWRARQNEWSAGKSERQAAAAARATELRDEGKT